MAVNTPTTDGPLTPVTTERTLGDELSSPGHATEGVPLTTRIWVPTGTDIAARPVMPVDAHEPSASLWWPYLT